MVLSWLHLFQCHRIAGFACGVTVLYLAWLIGPMLFWFPITGVAACFRFCQFLFALASGYTWSWLSQSGGVLEKLNTIASHLYRTTTTSGNSTTTLSERLWLPPAPLRMAATWTWATAIALASVVGIVVLLAHQLFARSKEEEHPVANRRKSKRIPKFTSSKKKSKHDEAVKAAPESHRKPTESEKEESPGQEATDGATSMMKGTGESKKKEEPLADFQLQKKEKTSPEVNTYECLVEKYLLSARREAKGVASGDKEEKYFDWLQHDSDDERLGRALPVHYRQLRLLYDALHLGPVPTPGFGPLPSPVPPLTSAFHTAKAVADGRIDVPATSAKDRMEPLLTLMDKAKLKPTQASAIKPSKEMPSLTALMPHGDPPAPSLNSPPMHGRFPQSTKAFASPNKPEHHHRSWGSIRASAPDPKPRDEQRSLPTITKGPSTATNMTPPKREREDRKDWYKKLTARGMSPIASEASDTDTSEEPLSEEKRTPETNNHGSTTHSESAEPFLGLESDQEPLSATPEQPSFTFGHEELSPVSQITGSGVGLDLSASLSGTGSTSSRMSRLAALRAKRQKRNQNLMKSLNL